MEVKEKQNRFLIKTELTNLNEEFLHFGYELYELKFAITGQPPKPPLLSRNLKYILISIFIVIFSICYQCEVFGSLFKQALGVRCIIPNNVFVWEATRPVSDCQYCINVTEPILLYNITREEFSKYAYTSKPVVIKKSFLHWPAVTVFSFKFFKNLYDSIDNAYRSVDEDCQFLHFRSNFISLRDVFAMSEARSNNSPGETSWYVGWGNCDPDVLKEMHKYYPKPHFLPADSEQSGTEFVFMGYDSGATLHVSMVRGRVV
ncbi:hypothetical protein RI129_008548 [Pyrocoelia pectoralis]|uniref:Uncharacterized protein n=1 Tax=Pyrocoelia pectoralis TaxID=417401 RepID=A0AAN7ZKX8_9COLE